TATSPRLAMNRRRNMDEQVTMPRPMPTQTRDVLPDPDPRFVRTASGERLRVPEGWTLLPPGDPGLTRRVKREGPTWTVQERRGRKIFSRGVWAPAERVERVRAELASERSDPRYHRRLEQSRARREAQEAEYARSFCDSVFAFLAFDPRYEEVARCLAEIVTAHAAEVGSGTVARTERIPIEQRAEAAVIAWMRHQTTGYDEMRIPRVKGMRREVRRMLATRSRQILERYRRGEPIPESCPL